MDLELRTPRGSGDEEDDNAGGNDPDLMEGAGQGDDLQLRLVPGEVVDDAQQVAGGGISNHIFFWGGRVLKSGQKWFKSENLEYNPKLLFQISDVSQQQLVNMVGKVLGQGKV